MVTKKRHIDYILEQECYTLADLKRSFNYIKDNKQIVKGRLLMHIDAFNFLDREFKSDPSNSEIKKRFCISANFLYEHSKNQNLNLIGVNYLTQERIEEVVNGNI